MIRYQFYKNDLKMPHNYHNKIMRAEDLREKRLINYCDVCLLMAEK